MDAPPQLPAIMNDESGEIVASFNPKHMRNAVAQAFEQLGGVSGLVEWAKTNLDTREKFYTKLAAKLIVKEIHVDDTRSIEDVIFEMDGLKDETVRTVPEMALDAEYENMEDYQ